MKSSILLAVVVFTLSLAPARGVEVLNAGFGGHTARALMEHVQADVLDKDPTLVLLLVGTNEALNSRALTPPAEFRRNFEALCDRLRAKCPVLVMLPIPFHKPDLLTRHKEAAYGAMPPEQRWAAVRAEIAAVAAAKGLPVVDLAEAFSGAGGVGEAKSSLLRNQANCGVRDGVHPTPEGYRVIAAAAAAAIRQHALPTGRIVCFGDSITQGAGVTSKDAAYPGQLQRMLSADAAPAGTGAGAGQPRGQPSR